MIGEPPRSVTILSLSRCALSWQLIVQSLFKFVIYLSEELESAYQSNWVGIVELSLASASLSTKSTSIDPNTEVMAFIAFYGSYKKMLFSENRNSSMVGSKSISYLTFFDKLCIQNYRYCTTNNIGIIYNLIKNFIYLKP